MDEMMFKCCSYAQGDCIHEDLNVKSQVRFAPQTLEWS